jgi:3-oxoacyl-[acyl-carrier protein] reductase
MTIAPDRSPGGRVAIVTGASRGVGRETVVRLARLGYAVVVNYAHDQRTAESTVEAALAGHGLAVAVRADVGDDLDVERLFSEAIEEFGPVDAVVHTVRGRLASTPLAAGSPGEFDRLYRANVRTSFVVNQAAASQIRDGGAIVNLSSSAPSPPRRDHGAYLVTAAAVGELTRTLARELRDRDISVNCVSLAIGRQPAPARVADVIAWLLSDSGHGVTGQVIRLAAGADASGD